MRHRCAVRLTRVTTQDAQGKPLVDPLFEDGTGDPITSAAQKPTPVTEIQWAERRRASVPCVHLQQVHRLDGRRSRSLPRSASCLATICSPITASRLTGIDLGRVPRPKHLPSAESRRPTVANRPRRCTAGALSAAACPTAPSPRPSRCRLRAARSRPGIVHLATNGFVTLDDANGLVSLTVQAASPLSWPNFFGVLAQQNTSNPANFDLPSCYNPAGGAPGMSAPPVLETFTDLSLVSGRPELRPAEDQRGLALHHDSIRAARSCSCRLSQRRRAC